MKINLFIFSIVLLLFNSSIAEAQEKVSEKKNSTWYIGINYNYQYREPSLLYYKYIDGHSFSKYYKTNLKDYDYNGFYSFLFGFSNSTLSHEFELMPFNYSRSFYDLTITDSLQNVLDIEKSDIKKSESFLRYKIDYRIFQLFSDKLVIQAGFAGRLYFEHFKYKPNSNSGFPDKYYKTGLFFGIVPKIEYSVSNRIMFNLDFPFEFADLYYSRNYIDNPQLPEKNRIQEGIKLDFLPKLYTVQLGIKVMLN